MARVSWLKYAHLAYFSQPRSERQLYRLVKRRKVCRIVEVGISRLERSISLVRVTQRYSGDQQVAYTGIDWFDARSAESEPLTLKQAHSQLQSTGAKVRLVPGEPGRSLSTMANAHQHTGLILISAAVDDGDLTSAWFYVPRMLDENSTVLREALDEAGEPVFTPLSHEQIAALAQQSTRKRAA